MKTTIEATLSISPAGTPKRTIGKYADQDDESVEVVLRHGPESPTSTVDAILLNADTMLRGDPTSSLSHKRLQIVKICYSEDMADIEENPIKEELVGLQYLPEDFSEVS
mmetsp:Transcript_21002/g.34715  ORF Transcript_21002/g.34715 Transcript_21002/m.34715 type:complete len:109 (-) Transcript_21002:134-460(-)|eukprot:CAMPEP_0119020438 /NCGR_PEP_ID=MMETSP1176-20130426/24033_1 /TAXON_ID=265551 /ORGANISM="Synedropsis recta cf, Strain CCMP1620" /LENGTH=108 /DNA_ID=CAMNT_0006974865 /DNA_START=51 /DNA_END=377 /DNA_ORIENTATION=-